MMEFFQNLNIQDLWVALMSFLSLNGMTIIGLIIAWAKGKIKHTMQLEQIKAEAKAEEKAVTDACNETLNKVGDYIKELELRINEAIKVAQDAEKKEIEAQSIKLTETLNEAKAKSLSLTDELNKI